MKRGTLEWNTKKPKCKYRSRLSGKCTQPLYVGWATLDTLPRKDPVNREKRQKLFKNMIRNALYELPNQKSSFRTQTYNVNVDVNDGYTRENSPKDSMPLRLVPSRTQRVGTKRGQPAEQSIEINDAVTVYKPVPSWSPDAKRVSFYIGYFLYYLYMIFL